ncbi:MAG: polysaccharide deacetylase family protein [Myxococcales bacterium]|nr:polysaccharide deacetylase family protein [Myxococcales bacterium]
MADRRASLPEKRKASRFALPVLFVACAALGSALGVGTNARLELPRLFSEPAKTPAPDTSPSPKPEPVDLANVKTPTAFPRLNPERSAAKAWLVAEGPEPTPGDGRRYVTFTFDDGPFLETTPAILRVLAQRKVHATFFVVGQYLDGNARRDERTRQVLRDIAEGGHLVGNHTLDHRLLPTITRAEVNEQIDETSRLIERTLGKKPTLFRPPYGEVDAYTREIVRARGMELVLWSIEAGDMTHDDPEAMARSLRNQIEYNGGGIVLLHDIRPTTLPTLKKVLTFLHQKRWRPEAPERVGYQIVDLPTYFALTEASPRPYANREALENARRDAFRAKHPGARAPRKPTEPREEPQSPKPAESTTIGI